MPLLVPGIRKEQQHALDRYGISDLLNDPKTLESLEPNQDLLTVSDVTSMREKLA